MEEKILEILRTIKGNSFSKKENLMTDGYLDSFDLVQLVTLIDKEYKIKIPIEMIDLYEFNSLKSIAVIVERCINDGQSN